MTPSGVGDFERDPGARPILEDPGSAPLILEDPEPAPPPGGAAVDVPGPV